MVKVGFETTYQAWREGQEQAVSQLAVLERSGVQGHSSVVKERLDFCDQQLYTVQLAGPIGSDS